VTTNETTARDRAIEVTTSHWWGEIGPLEARVLAARAVDELLANPEVLHALAEQAGATVREWGACDLRDDPNDPTSGGGVDPADDEDDAHKGAASWSTGRVCWRDVTYGPWRTR
jgi:hypothetical protein